MTSLIQQRTDTVAKLRAEVKDHPMCLWLAEDPRYFQVIFPDGDFPVDGLRASKSDGKTSALKKLLTEMERIWLASYPSPFTQENSQ